MLATEKRREHGVRVSWWGLIFLVRVFVGQGMVQVPSWTKPEDSFWASMTSRLRALLPGEAPVKVMLGATVRLIPLGVTVVVDSPTEQTEFESVLLLPT